MSPASATPAVRLRDGAVRIGGREILTGVDLDVAPGEFIGVLGSNGAGKSTLMKALLGLHPLAAGDLRVLDRTPVQARGQIGYLPQRRRFEDAIRVRGIDVVRLGLDGTRWGVPLALTRSARARRAAERARVAEVIELVGASSLRAPADR